MLQVFSRSPRAARMVWLLLAVAVVGSFAMSLVQPAPVFAQAADEAAAPEEAAAEEPGSGEESVLMWLLRALGWRYWPTFLLLSFTLVSLLIMNFLYSRRDSICPLALIEGFEAHLSEKRYQEAYEMAKADESFLGKVLAAGLATISKGYAKAIEAMQEVAEEENMKIDHRLSYLSLIGSISTMVGLLGTVDGMIGAFIVIANSPTTPKPSELATGISMAMVTTLAGLVVAIPAIMAFNLFRNRFQRLSLEVGRHSETLMSHFEDATTGQG